MRRRRADLVLLRREVVVLSEQVRRRGMRHLRRARHRENRSRYQRQPFWPHSHPNSAPFRPAGCLTPALHHFD
jgi:hypothetical protein